jgi:hypothetical protein
MEVYVPLNFSKVAAARALLNLLGSPEMVSTIDRWLEDVFGIEAGGRRSGEFWEAWDDMKGDVEVLLGNELLIYTILFGRDMKRVLVPDSLDRYLEHNNDGDSDR